MVDNGLRICALTSSMVRSGFADLLDSLQGHNVDGIELYAFRDADYGEFFAHAGRRLLRKLLRPDYSAADFFAQLTDAQISDAAARIAKSLKTAGGGKFRCRTIATYFPEVTFGCLEHYSEPRTKAIDALVNIARIGSGIYSHTHDENQKVVCVEMVCGSLLDPCYCGQQQKGPRQTGMAGRCNRVYKAKREEKFKVLKDSLKKIIAGCNRNEVTEIGFALEIEPGPFYVLSEGPAGDLAASLGLLKHILDDSSDLKERVGLNVDIGHLIACDIVRDPKACKELGRWKQRVFNFHISDNPGFHFQDLVPGTFHCVARKRTEDFWKLLSFAVGVARCSRSPYFSGSVSIELEGCDKIQWILTAARKLRYLIEGI